MMFIGIDTSDIDSVRAAVVAAESEIRRVTGDWIFRPMEWPTDADLGLPPANDVADFLRSRLTRAERHCRALRQLLSELERPIAGWAPDADAWCSTGTAWVSLCSHGRVIPSRGTYIAIRCGFCAAFAEHYTLRGAMEWCESGPGFGGSL